MPRHAVAIVQSNYIPWKGYFDLIHWVDEFILLDDVQYTRRDWRNRNLIKTPRGLQWLTIPVQSKGRFDQTIAETMVDDPSWVKLHWDSISHNYARAPYFRHYENDLRGLYLDCTETGLSQVNRRFISAICGILGIKTPVCWSSELPHRGIKTERLISLCQAAHATVYVSGPAARAYLQPELFNAAGIELEYVEYSGYLEYPQLYPPFEHHVTVLDLLFNAGPETTSYMRTFSDSHRSGPFSIPANHVIG